MRAAPSLSALALLIALGLTAFGLFSLAHSDTTNAQPAHANVTITVGDDWFCNPSFEGQVCQTNLTNGETVTWTLTEGNHTVTQCQDDTFSGSSCSGGWDSGTLSAGQSFQQTFNSAGTFYYRCNLHPGDMFGQLDVSAAPTPTSVPPPPPTPTSVPPPPPAPTGDQPTGSQPTGDQATGDQPTGDQSTGDQPAGGQTPTPAPTSGATPTHVPTEAPSPTHSAPEGAASDGDGGISAWWFALIGIPGGLALIAGTLFVRRRYRP